MVFLRTTADDSADNVVAQSAPLVVVVGRESVGKSQLIASLTGRPASESNFRGSTVTVERYACEAAIYIDTPGILRQSDTASTRLALAALDSDDQVLLVVQATQLDDDLAEMLPLVAGRRGAVVVTFWDKVQPGEAAQEALERLSREAGVPFIAVNARQLTSAQRTRLQAAHPQPGWFATAALRTRAGWRIEPRAGWLEHRVLGPILAVLLLILPALSAIYGANALAERGHPVVQAWLNPLIDQVHAHWPVWSHWLLISQQGDFGYGLLNMGPFLLLWALPTVVLFALVLAVYKSSGLVERMNVALHPLVRPFGLSGRDVVRVMMGFGCNVPAVISTRACSGCSRGSAIAAIAYGAACSYQLPATLAVLSAAAASVGTGAGLLAVLFLSYLLLTTLLYLRLTSARDARSQLNLLLAPRRPFMQWPTVSALWREARGAIRQFLWQALPVFALICALASLSSRLGWLEGCARVLGPVMAVFRLPAEAALPVVLASVRKDGIFLFTGPDGLAFPMTAPQVLTAVYLAGVLLPCLVTTLTIGRETSWRETGGLLLRQAGFALLCSLVLAWGGAWIW